MIFDTLWTTLIGIIGGIISSIIVSRVFLIQSEHQQQMRFVDKIIRKIGMIAGYLAAIKSVFEVSYDEDVHMEQEMKEKGYKCEMEYYAAHRDRNWISKSDLLETFKDHMRKIAEEVHADIINTKIEDTYLIDLLHKIDMYLHDIKSVKELTFSQVNQFKKEEQDLLDKYNECKRLSGKQFVKLVLKDKVMLVLCFLIVMLVIGTITAFILEV